MKKLIKIHFSKIRSEVLKMEKGRCIISASMLEESKQFQSSMDPT